MPVDLCTAYSRIKTLNKRFRIVRGSMSASKTYSILIILYEKAYTNPGSIITIITSTYVLLKDGVIADMKNIFDSMDLSFGDYFNVSTKDLTLNNGSVIQFRNLDSNDSSKGKGSRRDYLFCNEVNRLSYSALDPYIVRTDKAIYMDFNHDRLFFVDDIYLKGNRHDVDFITVTYKDNELIPKGELKTINDRIKASKEPDAPDSLKQWVRVFVNGEMGQLTERQIYTYEFIDKIPDTAKRIPSGMDFGFNPDPTTLIDLWIEGANIYADEVFTMNNLEPVKHPGMDKMAIVDKLDEVVEEKGRQIIADSSGGRSIKNMQDHKYNVFAVKKDKLVMEGIKHMRSYNLFITKRSTGIKKGCESWHFDIDDSNNIIPGVPKAHEPDQLAAIRYVLMMKDRLWKA